jgi:hypothetical protein
VGFGLAGSHAGLSYCFEMSFSQDPDRGRPPKQINAFVGLFDKPPHRDWLVWWTAGWTIIAGLAIGFPTEGSTSATSLPRWADALLAAIVFGILFGCIPAYLRLLVRRVRFRRSGAGADVQPMVGASGERVMPMETAAGAPSEDPPRAPRPADPTHVERSASSARATPDRTAHEPVVVGPPDQPRRDGTAPDPARPTTPSPKPHSQPSAAPVDIDVLDPSQVRDSAVLSLARRALPYPVARAVRVVQQSSDMKATYEAVLHAAEALSTVLGITAVLWARRYDVTTPELRKLQTAFDRSVSWGLWTDAARSVHQLMTGHPHALPGMGEALRSGKRGTRLVADLQDLANERNNWAHGRGPRNQLEAAQRLQEVFPMFERALESSGFLSEMPWMLTHDSKLRRREGDFQIQAARGMGDHPDFDVITFTSPVALAEETFYLLTPDGLLDMTPLVVFRVCPTCHQHEVAYAEGLDERKGVALKTFDRGHVVYDASLIEEVRHLIQQEVTSPETETA